MMAGCLVPAGSAAGAYRRRIALKGESTLFFTIETCNIAYPEELLRQIPVSRISLADVENYEPDLREAATELSRLTED